MTELEPRVSATFSSGSKAFIEIEGWNLKDKPNPNNGDIRTIRNNLIHHEWVEASRGKDLFNAVILKAWLHFLELVEQNPDFYWRYIHYRRDKDARTHNIPTS